MDRVLRVICGHPWVALAGIAVLTAYLTLQLYDPRSGEFLLELDASTERLLPEDDEDKRYHDHIRRLFESDESLVVAVHSDELWTRPHLLRVKRIAERIQRIRGVRSVTSLVSATNLVGSEGELHTRPFLPAEVPESPEELARIREAVLANPLYAGNLVSTDGRTTALVVSFRLTDREFVELAIDAQIEAIADEEAGDAQIWIAGGPYVRVTQIGLVFEDLRRGLPLIGLVLALVLAASFRTIRGLLLPLVTVAASLLWTLGLAAWFGDSLNIVSVLVPPLLLILGLSYSVHVVAAFYEVVRENESLTAGQSTLEAMRRVWLPVALTGFTTGAGFLALALSPMRAVSETGVLLLGGILFTLLGSLVLTPALLAVTGRPRPSRRASAERPSGPFAWFAERAALFALRFRREILIGAGAVAVLAFGFSTQLEVGADAVRALPEQSRVRLDFEAINDSLQGANQFNIIIQASEPRGLLEPDALRELEDLQRWLAAQPLVGGSASIVDFLKLLNRGLHEDDPNYARIPETRRLTAQLLFFGAGDEIERFIDLKYETANILVRSKAFGARETDGLVREIERRLLDLPATLEGRVTGSAVLLNNVRDQIVRGQASSVMLALAFIFVILWFFFLDWTTGLKALVPNVLPIAVYFGALGYSGITLNPSTSLIAPMALGIAIDDTIHYFARFTSDAKSMADERRATVSALQTVGRPVTYTTIAICLGFLVLTGSDLGNFVEVGALGAFTLGFAWVVDFTLTPAICSGLRIVTLWDTLTFDLGEDPQHAIRIFKGLTPAQCRVVALMASVREVAAGEPLMRVGETGREMYVVIDGKLRIWVPGDAGDVELNQLGRGASCGEAGLFHGTRTSNVDVLEDSRLIRISPSNMERLRRRYPKLASVVFWNINEVVSELLARTTARVH